MENEKILARRAVFEEEEKTFQLAVKERFQAVMDQFTKDMDQALKDLIPEMMKQPL